MSCDYIVLNLCTLHYPGICWTDTSTCSECQQRIEWVNRNLWSTEEPYSPRIRGVSRLDVSFTCLLGCALLKPAPVPHHCTYNTGSCSTSHPRLRLHNTAPSIPAPAPQHCTSNKPMCRCSAKLYSCFLHSFIRGIVQNTRCSNEKRNICQYVFFSDTILPYGP